MDWGRQERAETAYLQVSDGNPVALALYDSLGFRAAYAYHYRRRALT
jgi:ribosomal protein S18 acetylase RimI-like enzyme